MNLRHAPAMSAEWAVRLRIAMQRADVSAAELARRIGADSSLVRKWTSGEVDNPRGDALGRAADALGVSRLWLAEGVGEDRPPATTRPASDDGRGEARRAFGDRVRAARLERGLGTHAAACRGLAIPIRRWAEIEDGRADPTLVELEIISDRVRRSLDWLVAGLVAPIDRPFPIRDPDPNEPRTLHEPD